MLARALPHSWIKQQKKFGVVCERIVLRSRHIDITLRGSASPDGQGTADAGSLAPITLQLPWTPTGASARKGIAWKPSAQANLDPVTSDILLTAMARARSWMQDLSEGRVNSFEQIARSENKVQRHIRRLIPLAFVSPRIVDAIANGSAPADLTVTPARSMDCLYFTADPIGSHRGLRTTKTPK
jgi:hypothetical protein